MIHARGLVKRFGDLVAVDGIDLDVKRGEAFGFLDRKSTRLNSSHTVMSYAVFCLKKKKSHSAPGISRFIAAICSAVAKGSFSPSIMSVWFFFFHDTATTEIYTLSLHDALPL